MTTLEPRLFHFLWTAGLLAVFALGCGDDDGTEPSVDMGMDVTPEVAPDLPVETGIRAVFAPSADPMDYGTVPFPDDLYLSETGGVALGAFPGMFRSRYEEPMRTSLAQLNGFSVVSTVFVPIDGDIDPMSLPQTTGETLAADASVYLVSADSGAADAFERIEAEVDWVAPDRYIAVRPVAPLAPGQRYAAVVTRRVMADGAPLLPSETFASLRDADAAPEDAILAEAYERYRPVLDNVEDDVGQIASLAVFTTQNGTQGLVDVRAQVQDLTPEVAITEVLEGDALDARLGVPAENLPGRGLEGGIAHDAIAAMVNGTFEAPNYMDETVNVHGPFERDESGAFIAKRMDTVPFTLTLPVGDDLSPPVAIVQHGITQERSNALAIANTLARAGYATVAIDAPFHGLRASGSGVDEVHEFTDEETPDGFGDLGGTGIALAFVGAFQTSGDLIPFHPAYFRDALRQSVADLHVLVRVLRSSDLAAIGERDARFAGLDLSTSELAFIGQSLGGIIGTMFTATEPEIGASVLAATGGPIDALVQNSSSFNAQLALLFPNFGVSPEFDYETQPPLLFPGYALYQLVFDSGDAAAYGRLLREAPTDVFMLMLRNDETIANSSTETLARAIGVPITGGAAGFVDLPTAELPLRGNVMVDGEAYTRGVYVYETGSHGSIFFRGGTQSVMHPPLPPFVPLEMPVEFANPIDAIHGQVIAFFESWRAGSAEIVAPE